MKLRFALLILLGAVSANAAVVQHIGNYTGWGSVTWNALNGLNDSVDGNAGQLEFVGNTTTPGAYWGMDNNYVFFRMRLDVGSNPSFSDSHFVLIDIMGDYSPDYAFAWDSKSTDQTAHGLEMLVFDTSDGTWGGTKMDDFDGHGGQKLAKDINGDGRTTDGYVQSTDNVGSAGDPFGTTTFLDFAVSLSYLSNYVPALVQNTDWRVQFASIANSTDHNLLSADIAGGQSPSSAITAASWTTVAIPEPAVATLILGFGAGLLVVKRLFA